MTVVTFLLPVTLHNSEGACHCWQEKSQPQLLCGCPPHPSQSNRGQRRAGRLLSWGHHLPNLSPSPATGAFSHTTLLPAHPRSQPWCRRNWPGGQMREMSSCPWSGLVLSSPTVWSFSRRPVVPPVKYTPPGLWTHSQGWNGGRKESHRRRACYPQHSWARQCTGWKRGV